MEYGENEIGDFREITDWEGQAGTGMFPAVLAEGHPASLTAKTPEAAVEKDKVQKELEEAEPALEAAKAAHFSPHDTSRLLWMRPKCLLFLATLGPLRRASTGIHKVEN